MRVFVTGAAGFIGSHLCDRLAAEGHDVLGIDDFTTGQPENVTEDSVFLDWDVVECHEPLVRFRPDVVVHAAASYSDPRNWQRDARTNVHGAIAVARAAAEANVSRVVYLQTSLCYGLAPPAHPLPVTHPVDPHGSYAITKTAGEQLLLQSGLDVVSLRLANIYGPRNLSGPAPAFYKRIIAGKRCTIVDARRDFVYIDDAIDAFLYATTGDCPAGVYHVATGGDYPISAVYDAVIGALQIPPSERPATNHVARGPDDVATILLDPSHTEALFDWHASTPLYEGVRQAVAWYAEHGVGQAFTHLALEEAK